jgi:hypothetical protein
MPIQLQQPAGQLAVNAVWSVAATSPVPKVITLITIEIYSGSTAGTPVAIRPLVQNAGTTSAGGTELFTTAVPQFAQGQTLIGRLVTLYVDGTSATEVSPTPHLQLAAGTSVGPAPVLPSNVVALPELDANLASYAPQSGAAARLTGRVAGTAATYRSSFLRAQAQSITQHAIAIERQIAELQSLDVAKMTTAQQLAYPAISDALSQISTFSPSQLPAIDLGVPITRLGSAIRDLAMLQQIVDWLARTDILDFWYGLFDALVQDTATMTRELTRTRTYLGNVFTSQFGGAFEDLYESVGDEVDRHVQGLAGAVRAALSAATSSLVFEMRQLYAGMDAPLLAAPPRSDVATPPGRDDVVDVNPLANSLNQLEQAVDAQLQTLRQQANSAVANLSGQPARDLFVGVMVTYVCLPVLATLGVALAGGPAMAALLAGAACVAGQELLHLLLKWLGGPISDQLDGLRARVDAARRELEGAIASAVAATSSSFVFVVGAAEELRLVGLFLRELSLLVPDVFLTATADLLGRKRDELLRRGSELALATELAQSQEYGAVFDAIRPSYLELSPARLPEAPQLPGGSSRTRHVAETLLADLHRLDEQRLELVDGKQMKVTKRIGLASLAGTAALGIDIPSGDATAAVFKRLLKGEPVAVRLDEGDLLDGTHPGAYRALIDDVRVFAHVLGPVSAVTQIPVLITHTGVSRTRVRRPGGAPGGLADQSLRLLLSPGVIAAAYRRAIAGTPRVKQVASWFHWRYALGAALWTELSQAAAANELPEMGPMSAEWSELLWSLGLIGLVDPDETNTAVLQQMTQLHLFAVLFAALTGNPLPSFSPTYGDTTVQSPTDAQVEPWARELSATLIRRSGELSKSPLRAFAKWGTQVRLLEEIEPALRDVGFLTLERLHEPQALMLHLASNPTEALLAGVGAPVVFSAASQNGHGNGVPSEQKRPLEDIGASTTLLVQLPDAVNDLTGLYSATAAKIKEIVLEIDLRVCYDPELESAIRSSRRRAAQASSLLTGFNRGPVALPASVAATDIALGQRRILQLSLRAIRDRVLRTWKETVLTIDARDPTKDFDATEGIPLTTGPTRKATVNNQAFFTQASPFQLLPTGGPPTFTIQFGQAPPQTLGALASQLVLDPAQLGIDKDLYALLKYIKDPALVGRLHAIGIAVVPMQQGFNTWGGGQITLGSKLLPLVAGAAPPWPLRGVRFSSGTADVSAPPTAGVALPSLFDDPANSTIKFDLGSFVGGDSPPGGRADPIYDILVTLAYTAPVVRLAAASSALL